MKKNLLILLSFILISIVIYSCKLDPPILPGHPGYVASIPPGGGNDSTGTTTTGIGTTGTGGTGTGTTGTGTTTTISNSTITGTWTTKTTYAASIISGKASSSTLIPTNFFDNVILNDAAKTGVINVSLSLGVSDSVTYVLSKSGSNIYITLSNDPLFGTTGTLKIQVTSLTATTMTWLAIDPTIVSAGGVNLQAEYTINFTK